MLGSDGLGSFDCFALIHQVVLVDIGLSGVAHKVAVLFPSDLRLGCASRGRGVDRVGVEILIIPGVLILSRRPPG